ncbi:DUF4129 domain-containing protein [Nocardia asteroides NBRC 15531]|uniref:Protein-glutamine gamma-glutamyltransferase-like C-terminal domain-containing protein n=1 Tax=Nocardia asteroides NBRC 15531 TaxID=1110697 RepID=U5E5G6_NOCAS|nr:DUF4129 domain-containing protein [Nocardia asteroides]TLF69028.1 DUF4129 domain-containing protein [Nocardia asteroides NBRC 15531]UGT48501.1 DUF4129 domain-containing protein [Nocardia asteroides]SFL61817.1 protein of unknown function [Nocardia asteroides]VEG32119.1 Uncharacterised protein [Nocardia asteroides]GAD85012.1 hypothetical protein NCAST_25_04350 [Nocardia asteroides NBRC 15531]
MSDNRFPPPRDGAPPEPRLGAAADHRAAAEQAANRREYDLALRERFRAVLRALEQGGTLPVRRSRTAQETADDATTALPLEQSTELHPAARSFDEVVYGGRAATEDEYRRLEYADRYSQSAPPPALEPVELEIVEQQPRQRRKLPPLPDLLRNPRFWATVAAVLAIALLLYATMQSCGAPDAPDPPPPPPDFPDLPDRDDDFDPDFGAGEDSIFTRLPGWLAFGGLQFLIAFVVLMWWRGRRRGALVGEPRPVEVAANELLAGQAGLYRRSGDVAHVARTLRAATLRRIRPRLGARDLTDDQLVETAAARLGVPVQQIATVLFGPVPDENTLYYVAAHLEWIETELG